MSGWCDRESLSEHTIFDRLHAEIKRTNQLLQTVASSTFGAAVLLAALLVLQLWRATGG